MKPSYEHAGITIHTGECREVVQEACLPGPCVAITDPPLRIAYRSIRNHPGVAEESRARAAADFQSYLIAIGFTGDPTAFVNGKGGAQKKNSNTLSLAQSAARSLT